MTHTYLIRIRNFIILALIQVLIFSQIHLFGYATAYIYLLFILKLPRRTSRNELLIWSFLSGTVVDIFCNTPGINAAAATAVAFIRNSILSTFTQKETADDFIPGIHTMTREGYTGYILSCIFLFHTFLYLLELFTVNYPIQLLISVVSSTLLTATFILVTELFTRK